MYRKFMLAAIENAKKAAADGEIPVGAVIVRGGEIIAEGRNCRERERNPLGHAEIQAIALAAQRLGDWRLDGCEIYVTLEPCPMCAGAIMSSRIDTVIFGAYDEKGGCFGSAADVRRVDVNHKIKVVGGYMACECKEILTDFFKKRRTGG